MKKLFYLVLLITTAINAQVHTPVNYIKAKGIKISDTPTLVTGNAKQLVRNSVTGQVEEQPIVSSTVPDASETVAGKVSIGTQIFGGNKTIVGESSTVGNAFEVQNLAHDKIVEIGNNKEIKFTNLARIILNRVGNTLGQEPRIRFTGGNTVQGEIYAEQGSLVLTGLQFYPVAGFNFAGSIVNFGSQSGTATAPLVTAGNGYKGGIFFPQNGSNGSFFCVSTAVDFPTPAVERFRITNNGQVGIGTTSPNASSKVDVTSTTQGFLPPRMTTTQKNAIASPTAGLMVFDTDLMKLCVFTTVWETITSM